MLWVLIRRTSVRHSSDVLLLLSPNTLHSSNLPILVQFYLHYWHQPAPPDSDLVTLQWQSYHHVAVVLQFLPPLPLVGPQSWAGNQPESSACLQVHLLLGKLVSVTQQRLHRQQGSAVPVTEFCSVFTLNIGTPELKWCTYPKIWTTLLLTSFGKLFFACYFT